MLGHYNYKNYSGMLENFLDIVENDTSSILYHTRVLDEAVLNGILNYYDNNNVEIIQQNKSNSTFYYLFSYFNSIDMLTPYFDILISFYTLLELIFDLINNNYFSDLFLYFFLIFFYYY